MSDPKSVESRALDVVLGDNRGGSGWYVNAKEAVAALSSANLLRTDADDRVQACVEACMGYARYHKGVKSLVPEALAVVNAGLAMTPPAPKLPVWRVAHGGIFRREGDDDSCLLCVTTLPIKEQQAVMRALADARDGAGCWTEAK